MKMILVNLFLLSFLFYSCQKEEIPETPPKPKTLSMSAKINGADWSDEFVCGFISLKDSSISIEGGRVDAVWPNYTIALQIYDFSNISEGTYDLSSDGTGYVLLNKPPYTHYKTTIGVVTFTKIDKIKRTISGTFNFKATNVTSPSDIMNITDGVFTDLIYQYNHVSGFH